MEHDVTTGPWLDHAADVVVVSGPDAQSYLQSQLSQEIRDLEVGASRWSFVLDPTGKVDALARLTRTADHTYELRTDAGFGAALLARLERFKIRVRADMTLEQVDGRIPGEVEHGRVVAGWPRMGAEIRPGETIPAETGVTALAVDFRKGCYPGQELVERMASRGASPPRSLRRLAVGEGAAVGDPVVGDDGQEVGVLTSVSGTAAIASVKRSAAVGDPVTFS